MEKPRLYILTGFTFSGKTVLGRDLARVIDAQYTGVDEIADKWDVRDKRLQPDDVHSLHRTHNAIAGYYLSQGRSVIHDAANATVNKRTELKELAAKYAAESVVIHTDVAKEEAWNRWEINDLLHNRPGAFPDQLTKQIENYTPPQKIEGEHLVFRSGEDNINDWLQKDQIRIFLPNQINLSALEQTQLYMLSGPGLSGKTTFGQEFASLARFAYLEIDEIADKWGLRQVLATQEQVKHMRRAHDKSAASKLAYGHDVVHDALNATKTRRDEVRTLIKGQYADSKLIYIKTPTDEIWRRWRTIKYNGGRNLMSAESLEEQLETYEVPETEEHLIFRSGVDTVSQWMKNNVESLISK